MKKIFLIFLIAFLPSIANARSTTTSSTVYTSNTTTGTVTLQATPGALSNYILYLPLANGTLSTSGGGGSSTWGGITGTLSSQLDLQAALNLKQNSMSLVPGVYVDGDVCTYSSVGTLLNCNTSPSGTGTVTSITATSPLTGGAITASGSIGCQTASGSQAGCLSSSNWTTFNGKQSNLSLVAGTYADGKWCTYTSSGTLLNCNNNAPQVSLGLVAGTYINGDLCTYTASGTVLNCNTSPSGTGTVTSIGVSSPNSTLSIGSTPVTTTGTITADINWATINSSAMLKSAGVNWTDLNGIAKMNMGGINWNDAPKVNQPVTWTNVDLTSKTLTTSSTASVGSSLTVGTTATVGTSVTVNGSGQASFQMYDSTHTNSVTLKAPSSIASSGTVVLPVLKSTSGTIYVCVDSVGNLSAATSCSGS